MSCWARGPRTAGPAAAVEQAELDAARVREAAHRAAQRVDLADEVALGEAADRGIAGHPGDGVALQRHERGRAAHAGGGERGLAPAWPAPTTTTSGRVSFYFPMQNVLKIRSYSSSFATSPVISPSARERRAEILEHDLVAERKRVARAIERGDGFLERRGVADIRSGRGPPAAPAPQSACRIASRSASSPRPVRAETGIAPATEASPAADDEDRTCSPRRSFRRAACVPLPPAPRARRREGRASVEHEDDEIGLAGRRAGAAHPLGLDRIVRPRGARRYRSSVTGMPSRSTVSSSVSRVVPGIGDTIARSRPRSRLKSDDFPTLVTPDSATRAPSLTMRPRRASSRSDRADASAAASAVGEASGGEVRLRLVGELDRRLAARDEIDQGLRERREPPRQRPVHLRERDTRLIDGPRRDEIADRFGPGEIESPVPQRPVGELAGAGRRRARGDRGPRRARRGRGASVRPQLDGRLAGERALAEKATR